MAFANTFPDLCATLASDKNIEGNNFVITTLIGDLMFNTTMTCAYVIYKSKKKLKLDSKNIIKEILFYLLVLIFILYISYYYKMINLFVIFALIFFYIIYIVITKYISDKSKSKFSFLK